MACRVVLIDGDGLIQVCSDQIQVPVAVQVSVSCSIAHAYMIQTPLSAYLFKPHVAQIFECKIGFLEKGFLLPKILFGLTDHHGEGDGVICIGEHA